MNDKNKEMRMVLYHAQDDDVSVNALIENETLWVTQKAMAELFDCSADNISLHLKNIYAENELDKKATTEDFSVVRLEGNRQVTRTVTHYDLDAICSAAMTLNDMF